MALKDDIYKLVRNEFESGKSDMNNNTLRNKLGVSMEDFADALYVLQSEGYIDGVVFAYVGGKPKIAYTEPLKILK